MNECITIFFNVSHFQSKNVQIQGVLKKGRDVLMPVLEERGVWKPEPPPSLRCQGAICWEGLFMSARAATLPCTHRLAHRSLDFQFSPRTLTYGVFGSLRRWVCSPVLGRTKLSGVLALGFH